MKPKKSTITHRGKKLSVASSPGIYEKDFCAWTEKQAELLKHKEFSSLDILNLIEEIESLGRNDKRSLKSHLIVLLQYLLKMKYQSNLTHHLNSWQSSISDSKREITLLLEDSPSLINELHNIFDKAYLTARKYAIAETGLKSESFPKECPWAISEIFPEFKKLKVKKLK